MDASGNPGGFQLQVGDRALVTEGEFRGYEVQVTRLDEARRTVYFTMMVWNRPVELQLDFAVAAWLLEKRMEPHARPVWVRANRSKTT
jgi:hypothetical protein